MPDLLRVAPAPNARATVPAKSRRCYQRNGPAHPDGEAKRQCPKANYRIIQDVVVLAVEHDLLLALTAYLTPLVENR